VTVKGKRTAFKSTTAWELVKTRRLSCSEHGEHGLGSVPFVEREGTHRCLWSVLFDHSLAGSTPEASEAGINAVATIDSRKVFQSILFESDLRQNEFVGRIGGQSKEENRLRVKRFLCEKTPNHSELFLNIMAQIWVRCSARRETRLQKHNLSKSDCRLRKVYGEVDMANQLASYYERNCGTEFSSLFF
jgi:hypothetical protein